MISNTITVWWIYDKIEFTTKFLINEASSITSKYLIKNIIVNNALGFVV